MLGAILFGHEEIKKIVVFIEEIQSSVGKPKKHIEFYEVTEDIKRQVKELVSADIEDVYNEYDRTKRQEKEKVLEDKVDAYFKENAPDKVKDAGEALYSLQKAKVREKIALSGIRPDGRKLTEIRPIWCEHGILPRVHGSGVFTRGQTQVLTTATLGTISEVQKLEGIDDDVFKRYMHHYNMPPYSTGEAKPLRSPGRREIGHGALAERALEPVLPTEDVFPYAIRTVSEVLSSNGSTSQASVCGSTLALMDAGVPIKAPVAGIAMGLIKESGNIAILSDIQGLEDFFGDMDFKVAGTAEGITAIQMDIKIGGIDENILRTALEQARIGRLHILNKMLEVLPEVKSGLSKYAPKIISFNIDPEKIREVIGSGGKVINKIIEETGVKIDINDDGLVFIAGSDEDMCRKAQKIVLSIAKDPEIGDAFEGKVVRILQFGAFVELAPGKDGMIHISKLAKDRVDKVEDVVNIGDIVRVNVINIDDKNRIDLKLTEVVSKK
jgi:polyribonucleotide nucleotidyltransferase